jgi:hypothetical protein
MTEHSVYLQNMCVNKIKFNSVYLKDKEIATLFHVIINIRRSSYTNEYNITLSGISYEPRHDKTNIVRLRPAWIHTSLRIRAVRSGSMLFAYKPYNK